MRVTAFIGLVLVLLYAMLFPIANLAIHWNRVYTGVLFKTKKHTTEHVYFQTGTQPDWKKEGKEFMLNGNSYDVVEIIPETQGTLYVCYRDKIESILEALIDASTDIPMHSGKKLPYNLLLTLCFLPPAELEINAMPGSSLWSYPNYLPSIYFSPSCAQDLPPERV